MKDKYVIKKSIAWIQYFACDNTTEQSKNNFMILIQIIILWFCFDSLLLK